MEALTTVVGLVILMLALWGFSHYMFYVVDPRRKRPKIIAALEENERLGLSDYETDINRVTNRWALLNMAHTEPKRIKMPEYQERIAAQMKVLEPRALELKRHRNGRSWSLDFPVGI